MKSPFPGMDPFIEGSGLWEDFHDDLIAGIKRDLAAKVPDRYLVRTGERSYVVLVESEGKETHAFKPDVGVLTPSPAVQNGEANSAFTAVEADVGVVTMRAFVDERYRETFVEILEAAGDQRLVTSIEVLSPSNKRPGTEGWEVYQRKRQAMLLGAANLVEIDLVRGGKKLPMLDSWPNAPYSLLMCRQSQAPYCKVRPAHFRMPLPALTVPLADPDPDITVDLQPMVNEIYARSKYDRSIDYAKPLTPPFSKDEESWLAQQLQISGR